MEECFNRIISLIDSCDGRVDIVVLSEYCDVPVNAVGAKQVHSFIEK